MSLERQKTKGKRAKIKVMLRRGSTRTHQPGLSNQGKSKKWLKLDKRHASTWFDNGSAMVRQELTNRSSPTRAQQPRKKSQDKSNASTWFDNGSAMVRQELTNRSSPTRAHQPGLSNQDKSKKERDKEIKPLLSPNHLVYYACKALDDFYHFREEKIKDKSRKMRFGIRV